MDKISHLDNDYNKVLILDKASERVLSLTIGLENLIDMFPTMDKVSDRRKKSPSTTAVYVLSPTIDNVDLVIREIESQMYRCFYVFYLGNLSNSQVQRLRSLKNTESIKKMRWLNLDFFSKHFQS